MRVPARSRGVSSCGRLCLLVSPRSPASISIGRGAFGHFRVGAASSLPVVGSCPSSRSVPAFVARRMASTTTTSYPAWRVQQDGKDGAYKGTEVKLDIDRDLPKEGTLIRVSHSSLNYKDALSASGNKGVTKSFPHTPGIDAAGLIEVGGDTGATGERRPVIVTGYDLGMNTPGAFGEYIRVPEGWIAEMPSNWDAATAMTYGTAGLTAGLCISKLLRMGASPSAGAVAVTGATGSVGSVAVEILAKLGFAVTAISGKGDKESFLLGLGASEVASREVLEETKKPLVKPIFAGAVDTVGGTPLATLLKHIRPGGSVSCCGLVAGPQLETTVLPFILRGVNLLGVDSVEIPLQEKQDVWNKLATEWSCPKTEASARTIGRHELGDHLNAFLQGKSSGKIVLDHSLTDPSSKL